MKSWRFLLTYFAAWIPAAALYGVMIYRQSGGRAGSLENALWGGAESMAVAALLGLAVWNLTSRLADRARPAGMMMAAHASLALGYTLAWNGWVVASIYIFAPRDVFDMYVRFGLVWNVFTGLMMYGIVAGVAHAITVSRRLRREREATARAEALRATAELSALRAQMNPHFLFNTLHSIAALARTDPTAVEEALERLASLLRRLLDGGRLRADQVQLADEWDIVHDQLELEKLRFGDRLRVEASLEPDALDASIPIFALQTLVENAIKHGVAARTQPCVVRVTAAVSDDTLTIEVTDDGPGGDSRTVLTAPGLGLRSLRQRMLALHGDRGGMHVETSPGKGFLIRLTLPAAVTMPVTARASGSTASLAAR